MLLSETLYLRISPELKQELQEYAAERKRELSDLLVEAFGLLMWTEGAEKLGGSFHRPVGRPRQAPETAMPVRERAAHRGS